MNLLKRIGWQYAILEKNNCLIHEYLDLFVETHLSVYLYERNNQVSVGFLTSSPEAVKKLVYLLMKLGMKEEAIKSIQDVKLIVLIDQNFAVDHELMKFYDQLYQSVDFPHLDKNKIQKCLQTIALRIEREEN